jgi:hypothetical protein
MTIILNTDQWILTDAFQGMGPFNIEIEKMIPFEGGVFCVAGSALAEEVINYLCDDLVTFEKVRGFVHDGKLFNHPAYSFLSKAHTVIKFMFADGNYFDLQCRKDQVVMLNVSNVVEGNASSYINHLRPLLAEFDLKTDDGVICDNIRFRMARACIIDWLKCESGIAADRWIKSDDEDTEFNFGMLYNLRHNKVYYLKFNGFIRSIMKYCDYMKERAVI